MKRSPLLLVLALLSIALAGCVTGTAVQTGDHTYQPVADWHAIKIVFEKPTRPYDVIGPVSSLGAPAAEERAVYDMLRQQAAKLGADAVLVSSTAATAYRDGFSHGKQNSGLAIKYTDAKVR